MDGERRSVDGGAGVAIQAVVEFSSRGSNISGQVREGGGSVTAGSRSSGSRIRLPPGNMIMARIYYN
jgi:hypothetical protein